MAIYNPEKQNKTRFIDCFFNKNQNKRSEVDFLRYNLPKQTHLTMSHKKNNLLFKHYVAQHLHVFPQPERTD